MDTTTMDKEQIAKSAIFTAKHAKVSFTVQNVQEIGSDQTMEIAYVL
jgi:hypothetical protein